MRRVSFKPYIYIVFSIFILLTCYDTLSRAYFWSNSHNLAKTSVPYQRLLPEAKTRVLMIGDSTVVGTGARDPENTIAGRFGQSCKNWEIINLGKNGDRTIRLADRIQIAAKGKFDLVIIQIGGNDVVYSTPLEQITEDIKIILDRTKQVSNHVLLMSTSDVEIAPLFPWYVDDIYAQRSAKIDQIFADAAVSQGVIFTNTAQGREVWGNRSYWAGDRFHPNDNGYGVWYELIKRRLEQVGVLEVKADGRCVIQG